MLQLDAASTQTATCDTDFNEVPYGESVAAVRDDLRRAIAELNNYTTRVTINHYNERIMRAQDLPMMGERACYMLADLLHCNEDSIARMSVPWLLLYEHCLMIDDIVDERSGQIAELRAAAIDLLDLANRRVLEVVGVQKEYWNRYERYYAEWLCAMSAELRWSREDAWPAWRTAMFVQGRKSAMVKYCAQALVYIDRGRLLSASEECGLEHICAGVQALDDVADFYDDITSGRQSPLANVALKRAGMGFGLRVDEERGDVLPKAHLARAALTSGRLADSWRMAASHLIAGLGLLHSRDGITMQALQALVTRCLCYAEKSSRLEALRGDGSRIYAEEALELLLAGPRASQ